MATLHDRILKRVQNWNSLADPMAGGGFEFAGNVDRLIQSVDQSALARRIYFEGQSYKLEMLAGFGRLHQVRITMDGRKPIDFTFEASDSEDDTNAKVAEFNGVIADLALEMRGEAPVFEFLNYHFADGGVPLKAIKSFGTQDADDEEEKV